MFTRRIVTISATAIAAIALATPSVHAQDDSAEPGSLDIGSLELGSLEGGSVEGGSLASGEGDEGGPGGGSLASLRGDEGGSLGGGADDAPDVACDLPELGGSVAKFYPLFGLADLPAAVMDVITSTLDAVPNVLELVAGQGNGAAVIGQTGSLAEPLCTSILGGEMTTVPQPSDTATSTPSDATGTVEDGSSETEESEKVGAPDSAVAQAGAPLSTSVPTASGIADEGLTFGR